MLSVVSIGLSYLFYKKSQQDRALEFYNKGIELLEQQNYEGAIALYNEAIQLNPKLTQALVNKGYAYGKLNKFEKQLDSCKQATNIDPNSYGAWLCVGNAQSASKQYSDSIQYFGRAIDLACNSTDDLAVKVCANAWNNKGESLLRLKNPNPVEVLNAFKQAIQKNPKLHVAWTNKGEVLLNTSPQEALKAFNTALDIEPNYKPALEGKKTAIRRLGN